MSEISIDHLIFFVTDPAVWQGKLAAAGINAVYRDEGPGSDKHILAAFEGDSYIEVIRLPARPEDAHLPWEARLSTHGEGFGGFSLSVPDTAEALAVIYPDVPTELGEFGNEVIGVGPWKCRHGAPENHVDVTTPFVLQSLESRPTRAATAAAMPHPGGVSRFQGIVLSVPSLAAFEKPYAGLGALAPAPALDWSAGDGLMLKLGDQWIAGYVPADGSDKAALAADRGFGPVEASLAKDAVFGLPGEGDLLDTLLPLALRIC